MNRLYTNYSIAENRKEKYNHPLHNLEFKKTMGRTKNSVCLAVLKYFLQLSCLEHLYLYSPGSSIICLLTKGPFIYYVSTFDQPQCFHKFFGAIYSIYVLRIPKYSIKISSKCNVEKEILLF